MSPQNDAHGKGKTLVDVSSASEQATPPASGHVRTKAGDWRAQGVIVGASLLSFLALAGKASWTELLALISLYAGTILSLPAGRNRLISRAPLTYVGLSGTAGMVIGLFAFDLIGRERTQLSQWGLGYSLALWSGLLVFWIASPTSRGPAKESRLTTNPSSIWILASISASGIAAVAASMPDFYFENPQLARRVIASEVTPTEQILYKTTIVTSIILSQYLCVRQSGRKRGVAVGLTSLASIAGLSLYGGRLLVLLTLIGVAAVWIRYAPRVRPVVILGTTILAFVASAIVAAYRYYSLYNKEVTSEGLFVTMLSQGAIEFLDGAQIYNSPLAFSTHAQQSLLGEITDSIPTAFASILKIGDSTYPPMGAFASHALGHEFVGGIRLGAIGEWLLAYGLLGALAVGFILGLAAVLFARQEQASGPRFALAVCGVVLLISVLITGSGSAVSAIAVYAIAFWLSRAIVENS